MKRLIALALSAFVIAASAPFSPAKAATTTPHSVHHGIVIASNIVKCYYDALKWPGTGGQVLLIQMPGFPNLDNEEMSLDQMVLPAQAYLAGQGWTCGEIIDVQHETVSGYDYTVCAPPGWGFNLLGQEDLNVPPCPTVGQPRIL